MKNDRQLGIEALGHDVVEEHGQREPELRPVDDSFGGIFGSGAAREVKRLVTVFGNQLGCELAEIAGPHGGPPVNGRIIYDQGKRAINSVILCTGG